MDASQGERRCNYGAITLMMLSERCHGSIEAGVEQKVAATVCHDAQTFKITQGERREPTGGKTGTEEEGRRSVPRGRTGVSS